MQPALDSTILDRLIALGRQQGHLTNEDLQINLPIDSMSAEDIALIVVHLEEMGIPVELEDRLVTPHPQPAPAPQRSAEIIPFPGPSAKPKAKRTPPLQPAGASKPQSPQQGQPSGARAHLAVAVAGLLVLAALGAIVVLFGA
jgi:Sigma-70 factor, region 1.1